MTNKGQMSIKVKYIRYFSTYILRVLIKIITGFNILYWFFLGSAEELATLYTAGSIVVL